MSGLIDELLNGGEELQLPPLIAQPVTLDQAIADVPERILGTPPATRLPTIIIDIESDTTGLSYERIVPVHSQGDYSHRQSLPWPAKINPNVRNCRDCHAPRMLGRVFSDLCLLHWAIRTARRSQAGFNLLGWQSTDPRLPDVDRHPSIYKLQHSSN